MSDPVNIPTKRILLDVTPSSKIRDGLNKRTIAQYKTAYETKEPVNPVVVFDSGAEYYHVGDGYHRIEAAKQAKMTKVTANVRSGDQWDAFWFALEANRGGYRSAAKRRAAKIILGDSEHGSMSSEQIANRCGLHRTTVQRIRAAMIEFGQGVHPKRANARVHKRKRKKQPVYNIGKHTADQAIRLLKTIRNTDIEREEGLRLVCEWLRSENACQCNCGKDGSK